MMNYFMLFFFTSVFMFILKYNYLLLMLLSLEFVVISLFLMMMSMLSFMGMLYMSLVFMVMSVCEGVLGLSILVSMIRSHGNDYFQVFNILW